MKIPFFNKKEKTAEDNLPKLTDEQYTIMRAMFKRQACELIRNRIKHHTASGRNNGFTGKLSARIKELNTLQKMIMRDL